MVFWDVRFGTGTRHWECASMTTKYCLPGKDPANQCRCGHKVWQAIHMGKGCRGRCMTYGELYSLSPKFASIPGHHVMLCVRLLIQHTPVTKEEISG